MRAPWLSVGLRALAGVAGAAVVLGLLEGALRLSPWPDPGLFAGDPATVWVLRPGLDREVPGPAGPFRVRTDDRGHRQGGAGAAASGPLTVVLGCSTSFGWGVPGEAAWPAQLAHLGGQRVVNAAVPGWTSLQARRALPAHLGDLVPDRLILAFGVRDGWPAPRADAAARPTPALLRSRTAALLRALRPGGAPAAAPWPPPAAPAVRVSPADYAENLAALRALYPDAELRVLVFPHPADRGPWTAAAAPLGPVLDPGFRAEWAFAEDPVHLTAAGHRALAARVWAAWGAPGGG